jgi:hypothetical protein
MSYQQRTRSAPDQTRAPSDEPAEAPKGNRAQRRAARFAPHLLAADQAPGAPVMMHGFPLIPGMASKSHRAGRRGGKRR